MRDRRGHAGHGLLIARRGTTGGDRGMKKP